MMMGGGHYIIMLRISRLIIQKNISLGYGSFDDGDTNASSSIVWEIVKSGKEEK